MLDVDTDDPRLLFRLRTVSDACCVVCGRDEAACARTGTRLTAHHAISQQRLRRRGLSEFLWDARNGVPVCDEPCHRRHTTAHARIPRDLLPPAVEEFAAELGLTACLDREYGPREESVAA